MPDGRITTLLHDLGGGRGEAADRLLELVYDELRSMATAKMRSERGDHTLQATALVHEAYLRLVGDDPGMRNRAHFFAAAAKAMERVLIDHARARGAAKRGGGATRVSLRDVLGDASAPDLDLLALRDALDELESMSPEHADFVRCRFLLGLTLHEIAAVRETSPATLKRRWSFIRAWLQEGEAAGGGA